MFIDIDFDSSFFPNLHYNNVPVLALEFLLIGGWFFIFWHLFPVIKEAWLNWRQSIFAGEHSHLLMEIKAPSRNARNIEAIEQFFNHIHALARTQNWWEIWWKGQYNLKVSLEIVSFEGHIKFFVRSTYKHHHLIQHSLQAQYPDIEIKILRDEEDFVHIFPDKMPHSEFEMLGSEYVLNKPQYYPIKTYKEYIVKYPKREYLDPMRHLLELFSNLKEGEYMWYQIVIVPQDESWALSHKKEVDRLMGRPVKEIPKSASIFRLFIKIPFVIIKEFYQQLFVGTGKIAVSQIKDNTYQEMGRQLKGIGSEFKSQVTFLHEAFLSQFRKKKPKKAIVSKESPPIINNQISFEPSIDVNVPASLPSRKLTSKEQIVIDAMERKLSKQMYKTCVRILYFAKKPVFSKFRFWAEMHGIFRHFNDIDYNLLGRGKYSKTTADYLFVKFRKRMRQKSMICNAKDRDWYAGDQWNYLCSEELATLWHLPHKDDILGNIQTVDYPLLVPPEALAGRSGYRKENLLDLDAGDVPDNLPVSEFEPYNYP